MFSKFGLTTEANSDNTALQNLTSDIILGNQKILVVSCHYKMHCWYSGGGEATKEPTVFKSLSNTRKWKKWIIKTLKKRPPQAPSDSPYVQVWPSNTWNDHNGRWWIERWSMMKTVSVRLRTILVWNIFGNLRKALCGCINCPNDSYILLLSRCTHYYLHMHWCGPYAT